MNHPNRRTILKTLAAGAVTWTPPAHLWAKPSPEKPLLRFGLLADVQYANANTKGSRHYRNSLQKLETAVKTLNEIDDLAFVAHLGDTIDKDFASIAEVMPLFEKLKAPFHQILGNHDFEVEPEHLKSVPTALGMTERYSSFAAENLRFLILDGNLESLYAGEDPAEAEKKLASLRKSKAPQAAPWNGGLGTKQLKWLDSQLTAAHEAGEEVILFCHFPVFPANGHNLWDCDEVVTLLSNHPATIRAWFNGHNHSGNYGESHDIHYLTLKGIVETESTNAFSTVAVYPNHIEVTGFDREDHRVLQLKAPQR